MVPEVIIKIDDNKKIEEKLIHESRWKSGTMLPSLIIEKWYPKVMYIPTIEQNCGCYRILTELGVVSYVQFFEISNYT